MSVSLEVLQTPEEVADSCVKAWQAREPLSRLTVIVPGSNFAHSLTRMLVDRGMRSMAGIEFVTPGKLAGRILEAAGMGEQGQMTPDRALALDRLFRKGRCAFRELEYFKPELLSRGGGYAEAFAQTISECETAMVTPDILRTAAEKKGLDALGRARMRDLAAIWQTVDAQCARSGALSFSGMIAEAAQAAREHPELAERFGRLEAIFVGQWPPVFAAMLGALAPERVLALIPPPRQLTRPQCWISMTSPFGPDLNAVSSYPNEPCRETEPGVTDLADLKARVLQVRDSSTRKARPGDGTVRFFGFAGVAEELKASVDFVIDRIATGVPLQDIAIAAPLHAPWLPMVADRLATCGMGPDGKGIPAVTVGGRPVIATETGRRLLALLEALRDSLPRAETTRLLRFMRVGAKEKTIAGWKQARAFSNCLGAPGGLPGFAEQYRSWADRLDEADAYYAPPAKDKHKQKTREEALKLLELFRSGVRALVELASVAALEPEGGKAEFSGSDLVEALEGFIGKHFDMGPRSAQVFETVTNALEPVVSDPEVTAHEALAHAIDFVKRMRFSDGRFGDPAVHLLTIVELGGLTFDSVMVMGLTEGTWPGNVREDPILPDELRMEIEADGKAVWPALREWRPEQQKLSFSLAVRAAREVLALSFSSMTMTRIRTMPSPLLLEAAGCIPRIKGTEVPSLDEFRTEYCRRDLDDVRERGRKHGAGPAEVLRSVAEQDVTRAVKVPGAWLGDDAFAVDRARDFLAAELSGRDAPAMGVLGNIPGLPRPGLKADKAISPSRLDILLNCPRQYFFSNILYFDGEGTFGSCDAATELDPMTFGSAVHDACEAFYRQHGAEAMKAGESVDKWRKKARPIFGAVFERYAEIFPFASSAVRDRERKRFFRSALRFLEYDFARETRAEFVGVELAFDGYELDLDGGPIYLNGRIDRVDRLPDGKLIIRDIKTGKSKTGKPPDTGIDLQIGVYSLVAPGLVEDHPESGAAAYVYLKSGRIERLFGKGGDVTIRDLEDAARKWLIAARGISAGGVYVRTDDDENCTYCPFKGACPDEARAAVGVLAESGVKNKALVGFFEMNKTEDDEEDG